MNSALSNRVKSVLSGNVRLFKVANRARGLYGAHAKSLIDEYAALDSIEGIDELRELRARVASGEASIDVKDWDMRNALVYGIWDSIFGSVGLPVHMTPVVEHGLIYYRQLHGESAYSARAGIATLGDYRKRIIAGLSDLPVFCVGPYIEYASPYYDSRRMQNLRDEWGKTLLVFPTHGLDMASVERSTNASIGVIESYAQNFDTVLVCMFWWDINDPVVDAYLAEGYRVVSAGVRYDVNFLSRLKSIIELSDFVIGDSVGTNVGYCLHLGKNYRYVEMSSQTKVTGALGIGDSHEDTSDVTDPLKSLLARESTTLDEAKNACEPFWGFSKVKSRKEISKICELTGTICELGKGRTRRYPAIAREILSSIEDDVLGYALLSEALRR